MADQRNRMAGLSMRETQKGLAPHGMRHSGEGVKGSGYFGYLPASEGYATEMSAEDEIGEFPLLVPTLSREEIEHLLAGYSPTEDIYRKAVEHAERRRKEGKSPFAEATGLKYPVEKADGGAVSFELPDNVTPQNWRKHLASNVLADAKALLGVKDGGAIDVNELLEQAMERHRPQKVEDVLEWAIAKHNHKMKKGGAVSQTFPLKRDEEDELKPTPKYPLVEKLGKGVGAVHEFVSKPFGFENPPGEIASELLGIPGVAKTLERVAYGDPLTSGAGVTTNLLPETTETLFAGLGAAPLAVKGAQKTVSAVKKAPEFLKKATDTLTSSKISPLAAETKTAPAEALTGATYATKQEGPFFRVRSTSPDASAAKGRGLREADELQGTTALGGDAGSTGSQVPTRLSDEEVARIIADPAANEPLRIAKKYTQETQGSDFVLPDMPESSLVKQSAIGRAQQIASEGSPEYKSAVFDAYAQQMPEIIEQSGAKNYDDLMEKAYRQMAKETDDQFRALPYNFSYHRAGEGNYVSSKEMAADVHGNRHLYVYQGGDKHDFLNRIDPVTGLNENEKFRAVHDLLGHAIYGNQFGPKGEEIAWAVHSQMYSPLARLAMTAETRGQNSLVNYSPLNAALKAEIAKYDDLANEARRRGDKALLKEIDAAKRQAYSGWQYAPNKAVLLPPEFLDPKYAGGMPAYLEAASKPVRGTETQSVLTHFSSDPNLKLVDPRRYGTGIKGEEAKRLLEYPGAVRERSYFYLGEPGVVTPEPGLGVNRYRGEASSLYDITQDPLNFRVLAREANRTPFTAKYGQGMTRPLQEANDLERLIKEYGYEGLANPKASKPMAIMFKETPVRRQANGGRVTKADLEQQYRMAFGGGVFNTDPDLTDAGQIIPEHTL